MPFREIERGQAAVLTIPTGLCPLAQGCEARATLGLQRRGFQPQRGCGAGRGDEGATPLGLSVVGLVSQGSSCLATLGFEPESLRDSTWEFPKGINSG